MKWICSFFYPLSVWLTGTKVWVIEAVPSPPAGSPPCCCHDTQELPCPFLNSYQREEEVSPQNHTPMHKAATVLRATKKVIWNITVSLYVHAYTCTRTYTHTPHTPLPTYQCLGSKVTKDIVEEQIPSAMSGCGLIPRVIGSPYPIGLGS